MILLRAIVYVFILFFCAHANAGALWTISITKENSPFYKTYENVELILRRVGVAGNNFDELPLIYIKNFSNSHKKKVSFEKLGDKFISKVDTSVPGYYEVVGDGVDGILAEIGSKSSGFYPFAIIGEDGFESKSEDYFIGMLGATNLSKDKDGSDWELYPLMGIKSTSANYQWGRLMPNFDSNINQVLSKDLIYEMIIKYDIWPIFNLAGIPLWAADYDRLTEEDVSSKRSVRIPPKNLDEYKKYLAEISGYILKKYSFVSPRTYELMAEPIIPWGWRGSIEEIVNVFSAAYNVLHAVDLHAEVAGPTISSWSDLDFLEELLDGGLGKYIDVLSIHPYGSYPIDVNKIEYNIEKLKYLLNKYSNKNITLIATEFGVQDWVAGGKVNQASAIIQTAIVLKSANFRNFISFYISDFAKEPGYGVTYNLTKNIKYKPEAVAPKPAFVFLATFSRVLSGSVSLGKLKDLGSDLKGYIFTVPARKENVIVVWRSAGEVGTALLNLGVENGRIIDSYGRQSLFSAEDGLLRLSVGVEPVYILMPSESVKNISDYAENELTSYPGVDLYIKDSKFNFDRKNLTVGIVSDEVDENVFLLKNFAVDGAIANFRVNVGDKVKTGRHVFYLEYRDVRGYLLRRIKNIVNIELPIVVKKISIKPHGLKFIADVRVENSSKYFWENYLYISIDGIYAGAELIKLGGGEVLNVSILIDSDVVRDWRRQEIKAEIKYIFTTYVAYKSVQNIDFIKKSESADNYKNTPRRIWFERKGVVDYGDEDLSVKVASAYDEKHFYLNVLVRDNFQIKSPVDKPPWRGDSVQIGMSSINKSKLSLNNYANENIFPQLEFCVFLSENVFDIKINKSSGFGKKSDDVLMRGLRENISTSVDGKFITYKIAVPWTFFPDAVVNKEVALSIVVNDVDIYSGYRKAWLIFDGIVDSGGVEKYGIISLDDK